MTPRAWALAVPALLALCGCGRRAVSEATMEPNAVAPGAGAASADPGGLPAPVGGEFTLAIDARGAYSVRGVAATPADLQRAASTWVRDEPGVRAVIEVDPRALHSASAAAVQLLQGAGVRHMTVQSAATPGGGPRHPITVRIGR